MKRVFASLLLVVSSAQADIAVIVHPKNPLQTPSREQVRDLFLGRTRVFPNGKFAIPIDQSSPLRAQFYQLLTARPIEQINAYWARIIFTGQGSPPLQMPDDAAVLQTVRENEGAIGYIRFIRLDKSVRMLFKLSSP